MTSEQIIGTILVGLPSLIMTVALGFYTVRKNRQTGLEANRNNAESNDIDRFKVFSEAYEQQRIHDAQNRAADIERIRALESKVTELSLAAATQGKQLVAIKMAVQNWFARLWQEWNHAAGTMPLPSTEELALLELVVPEDSTPE